jgi:hypothetical protein
MAGMFDDVKRNLNELWDKYGPRVEDMVKQTAEKAEELTQKARLKYDIYQQQRKIERFYAELGEKVRLEITGNDKWDFKGDADVEAFLLKIKTAEDKLKELQAEYAEIGEAEKAEAEPEASPEPEVPAAENNDTQPA